MARTFVLCAALALLATPAFAARYAAELDPAPFDATTKPILVGSIGLVSAVPITTRRLTSTRRRPL